MSASFFEGPEKKVELIVADSVGDLRRLGDEFWSGVVRTARAEVLSKHSGEVLDALLLSESSLFIGEHHITMITCGQTTLVDAVLAVIERIGADNISVLIYERKYEHFPDRQPSSFFEDARRLRGVIPGQALCFGDEESHAIYVYHSSKGFEPEADDTTLEVLMHGLDPEVARRFRGGRPNDDIPVEAGLDDLFGSFTVDDYAFSPAGYSLNAVDGASYYTIHVTPERVGSYVSFETNVDFRGEANTLVSRIVDYFRPSAFDVFAFCPASAPYTHIEVPGRQLLRHVRAELCGYEVSFFHYFLPTEGPSPARSIDLRS